MSIFLITFALCAQLAAPAHAEDCDAEEEPSLHNGLSLMQAERTHSLPGKHAFPQVMGSCGWSVFYDTWIPTFEKGEYEGPGREGGAHCLDACCADATCKGIALMSDEIYQCYKYSQLPTEVTQQSGQRLGNGHWMQPLKPAWSIFVKSGGVVSGVSTLAHIGSACGWEVHYDLWVHTFAQGEYEPNNQLGGEHCLVACCHDVACEGIALMSNEEFQCYKYKNLPAAVASHEGTDLGDGQWLLKRKPAWSIFVKTRAKHLTSPATGVTHALKAPAVMQVTLGADATPMGHTSDVRSPPSAAPYLAGGSATAAWPIIFHGAAISLAVVGVLVFMAGQLTSSTVFAKRLMNRNRLHSISEESETTKLLEGPLDR